ncbi:peptidoglycan/LPS O-acetylase OafA/YrhL [Pseudomonas duriflava]|uniref:Peptidoglycan/LPS O-acetylase OafA/YrhL n=1 Tax=Pseudomonas duriflava TaxID=459528 RepID=A0A562QCV5_9PSED|nr:acyltransferase [Pseudomonas duriflava]TWI53856.1 peptidoglycan/LPS O-acetylase OafA/YrhL [Pseudomonas duriflava]
MLVSLQALRALAAWLVVFHHFMQVFFDFHSDSLAGHLLSTRGQVGVDIFFVLSGFVIHLSTAGRSMPALRFMINRIARIVPAYWLYTGITALILYCSADVMPVYGVAAKELLFSLFFIPSQNPGGFGLYPTLPVGWTLNYEMLFYIVLAVSFRAPERWRVWIVGALVMVVSTGLADRLRLSHFYRNPIIYEFLLGMGVGILYQRGWIPRSLRMAPVLAVFAVTIILLFDAGNAWRLLVWGVPSALLIASCVAMEPLFAGNRMLKALGDWSYSVYLIHVIIFWLGDYWLHQRAGLSPYETLALCLPLILVLSWLSFEWVERRMTRTVKAAFEAIPARLAGILVRPR